MGRDGCCDNIMTQAEHDEEHKGQCPECRNDVDENGSTVESNHCSYSPLACDLCGYSPCDGSC